MTKVLYKKTSRKLLAGWKFLFPSLKHIVSEVKGKELLMERKYNIVNNTQVLEIYLKIV